MTHPSLVERPFAVLPHVLEALAAGGPHAAESWANAPRGAAPPAPGVRLIRLHGLMSPRGSWLTSFLGGAAADQIGAAVREAVADPSVRIIGLWIDSPGGDVAGVPELADVIAEARRRKRVVALVDGLMASAAVWVGSQAHTIVITPSGAAGSLGVVALHLDLSRSLDRAGITPTLIARPAAKAEDSGLAPLPDSARAHLERRVGQFYEMFVAAVARGRGVTPATVKEKYGGGRMLNASDAVAAGLVDRIEAFPVALGRLLREAADRAVADDFDFRARRAASLFGGPAPARPESELARRKRLMRLAEL